METVLSTSLHDGVQLPADPAGDIGLRTAVLSDIHLSPAGTTDGTWNNTTRRSMSSQLLRAAASEIAAAGHQQVLVLGDISDDGSPELIAAALLAIADAGLQVWAVPGNHDAMQDSHAFDIATERVTGSVALHHQPVRVGDFITLVGSTLTSADGGQTCEAKNLPDVTAITSQILLWAGHYPLISQEQALRGAGLRYPGDLRNLQQAREIAAQHTGAIIVLHGHLHTVITGQDGRTLQIGFPALVEWPHAWTDLRIETPPTGPRVRTAVRPVAGNWSQCNRNTLLASTAQTWNLDTDGCWRAGEGNRTMK